MKIKQKNKKYLKRPLVIVAIILLVAILAVFAFLFTRPSEDEENNSQKADEPSSVNAESATPEAAEEEASSEQALNDKEAHINQNDSTSSDNTSESITVSARVESSSVVITTKLMNIGSGTCQLSITNDQRTYTNTAEVIYQPSYSTCAGFEVPVRELGDGEWQIKITAASINGSATVRVD